MKTRIALAAMLLLAVPLAGCTTPEQKLATARISFNATVHVLANLREQGRFEKAEAENISAMINAGSDALDRWQAQLELGQNPETLIEALNYALRELVAARIKAERSTP